MLYWLLYPLREYFSPFNLFRYITFRAAYSAVTALVIALLFGPPLIRELKKRRIWQRISSDVPARHREKKEMPTMGGVLILFSIIVSTLLWARVENRFIHLILFSTVYLGTLGFIDDWLKLKRNRGLKKTEKLFWQFLLGLLIGFYLYFKPFAPEFATKTSVLFFKNIFPDLGWLYIPFVAFVIVGASNAVNLTDGLDGLAIGIAGIGAASYAVLSYVTGHMKISEYLNVLFLNGSGELTVFCTALLGGALGFLWYNTYPSQLFMGDVGSLAIGGAVGTVAVLIKQEILLLLVGGVFVLEAFSVIVQVLYFKVTKGKRIFKMSPLHHHYELKGWKEPKVVVRFWIIAILFAFIALSTLKVR